jgi:hypothetical protein
MNSVAMKRERKVFYAQGGGSIAVEVDTGGVWFNPRPAISGVDDNAGSEDTLKECVAKNRNRAKLFNVSAPSAVILFLASCSMHILSPEFSIPAVILSLGFIFSAAATIYFHVTSGGKGELAIVRYKSVASAVPSPAAEYRDYIRNAPGYSMPVLSPRLYSIITSGSSPRSRFSGTPFTVTARGIVAE